MRIIKGAKKSSCFFLSLSLSLSLFSPSYSLFFSFYLHDLIVIGANIFECFYHMVEFLIN